jgi:hypothetical protein
MINDKHIGIIAKHINSLSFVDGLNEDDIEYYYVTEENNGEYQQIDFEEVYIDDRNDVMDDKKEKLLKSLLKKDDNIPTLKVSFDRSDAYPNGTSLYKITVYV